MTAPTTYILLVYGLEHNVGPPNINFWLLTAASDFSSPLFSATPGSVPMLGLGVTVLHTGLCAYTQIWLSVFMVLPTGMCPRFQIYAHCICLFVLVLYRDYLIS